jgi:hypothetical protein
MNQRLAVCRCRLRSNSDAVSICRRRRRSARSGWDSDRRVSSLTAAALEAVIEELTLPQSRDNAVLIYTHGAFTLPDRWSRADY